MVTRERVPLRREGPGVERIVDRAAGIVRCDHRKAAIVGTGPSRDRAPYADPAWCVWALNEIRQPRYDRHFELHPMSVQSHYDLAALAAITAPCYVLELDPRVPAGVRYPIDRLRAASFREYFTCTFAYQLALALLDGFEVIGLWGVELFYGTARERTAERACVEYWLGVAEGRGVTVVADSGLARQAPLYGYDYDAEVAFVNGAVDQLRRVIDEERRPAAR